MMTHSVVLAVWQKQLERTVAPYLERAQIDGFGFQVVLSVNPHGKVGEPKLTIVTTPKQGG